MVSLSVNDNQLSLDLKEMLLRLKRLNFNEAGKDYRIGSDTLRAVGITPEAMRMVMEVESVVTVGVADLSVTTCIFEELSQNEKETRFRLGVNLID